MTQVENISAVFEWVS